MKIVTFENEAGNAIMNLLYLDGPRWFKLDTPNTGSYVGDFVAIDPENWVKVYVTFS